MGGGRFGRVLAAVSLAVVLGGVSLAAAGGQARSNEAPVEAQVAQQLARTGHASFWIVLHGNANVAPAASIHNRSRRGEFVYERLTSYARESQAPVRAWLDAHGVQYQAYWIVNAIFVKSAGPSIVDSLAARTDVKEIRANHSYPIPKETRVPSSGARPSTTEWGLNAINAPQVWSTFNDRGEGIVVSSIDTGVRYSHQALVGKYRGNLGGGNFDNNYNWWDPLHECPTRIRATRTPRHAHDGHDGRRRRRPRHEPDRRRTAREVDLAKGCCLDTALISSGQWILAPTDLNGDNPRPDLRPDIVNNSWGGGSGDPFFQPEVQAWVAAGIFPAFSNGNSGPACGTAGSPGDLPETYAAGGSTSTAPSRASRPADPRLSAGSSSRTSRRRASTSAPRRAAATRNTGA